jgi:rhamnopyranosyl-N-acetylglucosaminyl-diphospho-decaprenol beta-1,3/1,4-galactofuranosyltransferase
VLVKNASVCAVVVTYNRKDLLRECLLALQAQTRPPDKLVVINNASTDGTREMLESEFAEISVLNLTENGGGAGGFYEGVKWGYEQGYDWLWLMDDDGRPAKDCLEKLLVHERANCVLVPIQQDSSGRMYGINKWHNHIFDVTHEIVSGKQAVSGEFTFAFVGPLIAREVVEKAGLPNKDFFIWFDDHEYALRARSHAGAEIIAVPDAIFFHDFGIKTREVSFLGRRSYRTQHPTWKTYYGVRNQLYTVTRTRRKPQEVLTYFAYQLRHTAAEIVFDPDWFERLKMRLMGIRDGALGRLGKRVNAK